METENISTILVELDNSGWSLYLSLLSAVFVGLSGVVPLLLLPLNITNGFMESDEETRKLKLFLSFAVGSLLGDVFFHLLPESWCSTRGEYGQLVQGQCLLIGFCAFMLIEKVCNLSKPDEKNATDGRSAALPRRDSWSQKLRGREQTDEDQHERRPQSPSRRARIDVSGYLNLMANFADNLTHGIALAGSYSVSSKVGLLTTFAILIHEIPHEVGDFAILLKAGFSKWAAAKAQLGTSVGALVGVGLTFLCKSSKFVGFEMLVVIPFTAGGFLYIALVTVLPAIVEEDSPRESMKQLSTMCLGTVVMYAVTVFCEH